MISQRISKLKLVIMIRIYSGIGYDHVCDDYKVVRIVSPRTFICSVNSSTWRRIEDFPHDFNGPPRSYRFVGPHTHFGAFANGALHCLPIRQIKEPG